MKALKTTFSLLFFLFSTVTAGAENFIDGLFPEYGTKNIGIYTESYHDARSENFVFEVAAIRANGIIMNPDLFRYRYCNFDLTTPPLTTPGYPLKGESNSEVNNILNEQLHIYLNSLGWQNEVLKEFSGGSRNDLLAVADSAGFDAVLIVRYTPIIYFLPIDNYRSAKSGGKSSADIGRIKKGMGLIPAIELYDVQSGNRIWYSAYHTGHQIITKKRSFQEYVEKTEEFFIHTDKNTAELAADRMIELTLGNAEAPFPEASVSIARKDESLGSSSLKHMFWSDFPSYALYGTSWGIEYTFDYIGNLEISYKDSFIEDSPVEMAGTIDYAIMHSINIPFYSLTRRNLSIEPALSFGFLPPTRTYISYTDIKDNFHGGYYEVPDTTDAATMSVASIGFKLSLKYLLRLTDRFSIFIGGTGNISTWWQSVEGFNTTADNFTESYNGLYTDYNLNILVNASILAGVRWDLKTPVELFAGLTPIGPGDGYMLSAGIRYIPFTWGLIDPHASNIAGSLNGY